MKRILLFCLTSFSVIAQGQTGTSFPEGWLGNWKGTLEWHSLGKPAPQKVEMQLLINRVPDSANLYTWNLVYGKPTDDNRPYTLRAVDSSKGHWLIDEANGILLDQYLIGNRFSGAFAVGNSVIVNSYWLENDELHLEFYNHRKEAERTSGYGTEESPSVQSFKMTTYQRGILKRQK